MKQTYGDFTESEAYKEITAKYPNISAADAVKLAGIDADPAYSAKPSFPTGGAIDTSPAPSNVFSYDEYTELARKSTNGDMAARNKWREIKHKVSTGELKFDK